ncbi:MAG: hypothetical protein HQL69_14845 [Magnetococcales bacterium]|nr:hypothetical protein [Magnetococcales bacterium]
MGLLNCWNWNNCGRYPGGPKADEMGVCPATIATQADGFLNGRAAGRGCAYVTGTFCGGTVQGSAKDKTHNCKKCDFYKALKKEFKTALSAVQFNNYVKDKKATPLNPNLPWVAKSKSGYQTMAAAKARYEIKRLKH